MSPEHDKLRIASFVLSCLAILIAATTLAINNFVNQKLQVFRSNDIIITNEIGCIPAIQMQYSFTANGPNSKSISITRIELEVKRNSDGKSFLLYPVTQFDKKSDIPINLMGNSSYSTILLFSIKENTKKSEYYRIWLEGVQNKVTDPNDKIAFSNHFSTLIEEAGLGEKYPDYSEIFRSLRSFPTENKNLDYSDFA